MALVAAHLLERSTGREPAGVPAALLCKIPGPAGNRFVEHERRDRSRRQQRDAGVCREHDAGRVQSAVARAQVDHAEGNPALRNRRRELSRHARLRAHHTRRQGGAEHRAQHREDRHRHHGAAALGRRQRAGQGEVPATEPIRHLPARHALSQLLQSQSPRFQPRLRATRRSDGNGAVRTRQPTGVDRLEDHRGDERRCGEVRPRAEADPGADRLPDGGC